MANYTENFPNLSTYDFDTIMCQLRQVCGADPSGMINAQFLSRPTTAKDIAQLFYCTYYIMQGSENLQKQYVELYTFVKDFFTNLDLQEEVNNKINDMAKSGELSTILLKIINTGSPIFVSSTDEMTDNKAIYVLTTNGHIYVYKDESFIDTTLTYGSPDNVIFCSRQTTGNRLFDIQTPGYYALSNSVLSDMTDLSGVISGNKSALLLVVKPAFETATMIYQLLYVISKGKQYTYYRYFQPDLPAPVWNDITLDDNVYMKNYTLPSNTTTLFSLNTPGFYRITSEIFKNITDLENVIEGTKSGFILSLPYAFQQTSFSYQELTVISGGVYYKYRRYVSKTGNTGTSWEYLNSTGTEQTIKYIAMGDSRTKGITTTKTENYPEIIKKTKGYDVLNYGVSGSTMCYVDSDHEYFGNIITNRNDFSCDVLSIMYGRNDYVLNAPLGTINDTVSNTVIGSLYDGVKRILEKNPSCNIVIISPFNDFNYGTSPDYAKTHNNTAGWCLNDLNQLLKEFCEKYSFKYVDGTNGIVNSIVRTNIPDGTHLTDDSGLASFIASEIY